MKARMHPRSLSRPVCDAPTVSLQCRPSVAETVCVRITHQGSRPPLFQTRGSQGLPIQLLPSLPRDFPGRFPMVPSLRSNNVEVPAAMTLVRETRSPGKTALPPLRSVAASSRSTPPFLPVNEGSTMTLLPLITTSCSIEVSRHCKTMAPRLALLATTVEHPSFALVTSWPSANVEAR